MGENRVSYLDLDRRWRFSAGRTAEGRVREFQTGWNATLRGRASETTQFAKLPAEVNDITGECKLARLHRDERNVATEITDRN